MIYQLRIELDDVDRQRYERLDLRVKRHPSESLRYLTARVLGYCLSFAPGISFCKGGVSAGTEPPLTIVSPKGELRVWIEVGAPPADRLRKAVRAASRVDFYSWLSPAQLHRTYAAEPFARAPGLRVFPIAPELLRALEARLERSVEFCLTRNHGTIYLTFDDGVVSAELAPIRLDGTAEPQA